MPAGPGVAVLSPTEGGAVIAADKAEAHVVLLPQFTGETEAYLATVIPEYGSSRNPCDLTAQALNDPDGLRKCGEAVFRSEEHTSELQSLMRISYAVFCLKKTPKTREPCRRRTTQQAQNGKIHSLMRITTDHMCYTQKTIDITKANHRMNN